MRTPALLRLVAFHIPPGEHASAAERIHKHLPGALVLTRMMRTERLAAPE